MVERKRAKKECVNYWAAASPCCPDLMSIASFSSDTKFLPQSADSVLLLLRIVSITFSAIESLTTVIISAFVLNSSQTMPVPLPDSTSCLGIWPLPFMST